MTLLGSIVIAAVSLWLLPFLFGLLLAPVSLAFGTPPAELMLILSALNFVAAVALAVLYSHNWRLPPRLYGPWPPEQE